MYNHPTGAHFGTDKMFDKIKRQYFWPQMFEHIWNYVKTCDSCQKREKYRQHGPLYPIKVEAPFNKIGIDFVGPLPTTAQGNKYIIIAMDYMTKYLKQKQYHLQIHNKLLFLSMKILFVDMDALIFYSLTEEHISIIS